MPTKDPVIVIGLTGEVETIAPRAQALEDAGLNDIRYVETTPAMSAAEKHNALVDLAHELRNSQPKARLIVLKDTVRPLPGAKPMVEGALSFGPAGVQTVKELKQAIRDVMALEISAAPAAKPAAKPVAPSDEATEKFDHSLPSWLPDVATKDAKKPAAPKPKLLVLYYQPCNGNGIVTNPKADITHAMVVPKDLQHTEFLTKDAIPQLDRKQLGMWQSRVHGKPAFLKEMTTHFGESFWSNKKFDTAIATADELQSFLQQGGYDGVVVVGAADRKHYALLPENVQPIIQEMALDKSPCTRLAGGSEDLVNAAREAIGDVITDCKKQAVIEQEPAEIVKRALEKVATDDAQKPAVRVRHVSQAASNRALQPTRPALARSRYTQPHVLVIYAPDMADERIAHSSAHIEIDKAILVAKEKTGDFVNPDGAIQKSALTARATPLDFVADARSRFGEGFHRSVRAVLSTAEQLTTYLGKRRAHGSARETRAYDEIVLVGTIPEGFSLAREQIEAACKAHKGNADVACTFTHLPDVAALHARFPLETIEQSLGLSA